MSENGKSENSKMVLLTGLWKSQTKDGGYMLSGNLSKTSRIVVLVNKQKHKDKPEDAKKPDYLVFMATNDKPKEQEQEAF
jgi:hypothetical protein